MNKNITALILIVLAVGVYFTYTKGKIAELKSIQVVNAEYQKAIEQKVISTQATLKADQDLQRIKIEAQQAIAKAEGEAKAIAIQAQAIQNQGGAQYVQLKAIEKWDGNLPNVMSGAMPFINVGI